MLLTTPMTPNAEDIRKIIQLGASPNLFLSLYLATRTCQTTTKAIRLRALQLMSEAGEKVHDTSWEKPFQAERERVDDYLKALRPGGESLAILTSEDAKAFHALWLPLVVPESARFGISANTLPLIDLLDEYEPIAIVMVEKDKARVMVLSADQVESATKVESEVPGLHSSGGWAAARYQRHHAAHVEAHLKKVVDALTRAYRRTRFDRLFLTGPDEARTGLKARLPRELADKLMGELPADAHATDAELRDLAREQASRFERSSEEDLVKELITRSMKRQGATIGLNYTLNALNLRQVDRLVLADGVEQDGHYCLHCDRVLPLRDIICPACRRTTFKVDMWRDLAGYAMRHNLNLEVVHGEAAAALWHYDGIGSLLKAPAKH